MLDRLSRRSRADCTEHRMIVGWIGRRRNTTSPIVHLALKEHIYDHVTWDRYRIICTILEISAKVLLMGSEASCQRWSGHRVREEGVDLGMHFYDRDEVLQRRGWAKLQQQSKTLKASQGCTVPCQDLLPIYLVDTIRGRTRITSELMSFTICVAPCVLGSNAMRTWDEIL